LEELVDGFSGTRPDLPLQTAWMGYFPDERTMKSQLQQFTAFVLAAEYGWSGRKAPPSRLGYDPKEVFRNFYARSP